MLAFMPSTPVKSERRKKLRKKPLRLVYVELGFGNGGMMRDLSEEGFAVRAMMPLKQGDKTPFSFMLGDTTRIQGEGEVLWIDEGGRVAGVEFTQIPPEIKSQIDDWLVEDERIPSSRETAKEPAIAPASTMDELREEIRSTPVRSEAPEHAPAEVKVETPIIPEPEIEEIPPSKPKVNIAAGEQITTNHEPQTAPEPRLPARVPPKVVPGPSAPPASSVTEEFFRKWPKTPPASVPAAETRPRDLPPRPQTAYVAPSSHSEARTFEEEIEEPEDRAEARPLLPNISEILIQPRGLSPRVGAATRRLPELPEVLHARHEHWEWFTLGRAVLTMVVLTALAGLFVYHRSVGRGLIWLGEAMDGTSDRAANTPVADTAGTGKSTTAGDRDPNASQPERPASVPQAPAIPAPSTANETPSLSSSPKSTPAPVTPLSPPEASPDAGQAEYLQAVQLMRGRNSGNDSGEAVRLLWIAVEKGNPSAEVTLADLYWHGQGVVRNCDQARILFTAAARKGRSEAQKRLQQFQQEGCE